MAKIFYLREGYGLERVTGGFDIGMEKLVAKVGVRTVKFVGNEPPTLPTKREDLTRFRDLLFVLAQIPTVEVNQKFPKEGFYLLEAVKPKEANAWS